MFVAACLPAACGSSENAANSTCSGTRAFPITAVNDDTRVPLPGAIVAFEPNGLTEAIPNPKGVYAFGGQADANGTFAPPLSCGRWGVHVFASGYRCNSLNSGNTGVLEVGLVALGGNDTVPTIAAAAWEEQAGLTLSTQQTVTVTTHAASRAPEDAVTSVIVASTDGTSYRALALAPYDDLPEGATHGISDGITQQWRGTLLLPDVTGTLTYAILAATADCRTSKVLRLPITTSR